ncbi:MAG TPA: DMT family transporter [Xanthobacteraceae bacterium]|jgi:drug/metabolite transporter (DMT)-like permease
MNSAHIAIPSSVSRIPLPFLVAAFCVLWSSAFAVAKLAIADCPPLILLATRFLVAGMLMLGAAAIHRVPWNLGRRDLLVFAALGIANQAVYLGFGYVGMRTVSSGLAALVISANPVLTAVLAAAFLGERMSWRKVAGLLLGIGGVAFVVESRLAGGAEHFGGIVFTIAALVSLVGGTILFKRLAPHGGLWIGNGVQSLSAGLALSPFAFGVESVGDIVPSWRLLAAFIYLVVLVSAFAYLLWFHLLTVSSATAASSYHFMMPPLGMLFGWLLLDEHVAFTDLLGVVPVAIGIYLVTHAASSARR